MTSSDAKVLITIELDRKLTSDATIVTQAYDSGPEYLSPIIFSE